MAYNSKVSKNLLIGTAAAAVVYGFYYKEVMVPYRQEFRTLSYHLTDLRLIIDDEMEICETDPNLQNPSNREKMEKLLARQEKSAEEILKTTMYDWRSWPTKTQNDIHDFLIWTWPHYYHIKNTKTCPADFKNKEVGLKLKTWQDTISENLPRYWFL